MTYAPYYEWREAARFAGFQRFRDFLKLPGEEQSEIVAHYRCHAQAEAVISHEQGKENRRKMKSRGKGKPGG